MNRVTATAFVWWTGRTLRERRMLIVMMGLILATAIWVGVVRPVLEWRTAAADRVAAAATDLVEVRLAVGALTPRSPRPERLAGELEPLVRRTAEAAGVTVVTTMSGSGQLGFQASGVRSGALFAWLSALETDHGVTICGLGVLENANATLNAEGAVSTGDCSA